ncbi:carbohydrate kinase family protein [Methanobacterium petrolearium]
MEWEEGSSFLVDRGIPMVVVTNGREGARLFTEKNVIFSPAKTVPTIDTTGAGDNFAAGFITSYIRGEKPEDCLKFANHIASLCVQKMGGSTSGKIDLSSCSNVNPN